MNSEALNNRLLQDQCRTLIISNISKTANIARLIIVSGAHGFLPVLVGCLSTTTEKLQSMLGVDITFYRIKSMKELFNLLKMANYDVVGIEITDYNEDVTKVDSTLLKKKKIALMPGNEGTGLSEIQKKCCDRFIYIPQYSASIESFNVSVATAIVLNYLM